HVATRVVAGTYDLRYQRAWSYSNYDNGGTWVSQTTAGDAIPNGDAVLRTGIVIAPGAQTLDVDVPVVTLTGAITPDRGALAADPNGASSLFLANLTTGTR